MTQVRVLAAVFAAAGVLAAGAVIAKPGFGGFGPKMQFEDIDTDGNGEISQAEMQAQKSARFKSVDANGDGKLSPEEMHAMAQSRMADRVQKRIEHLDTDGDGALSESELSNLGRHGDMFKRLDGDESGGISKEEFEQARAQRAGKRRWGQNSETEQN